MDQVNDGSQVFNTNEKKYLVVGVISLILSFVFSYFPFIVWFQSFSKVLIVLAVLYIIPLFTMHFFTRKIADRSWGKTLLIVGAPSLVLGIFTFLMNMVQVPSIVDTITPLVIIAGWLFFFIKIFNVGFGKAFKIGFSQLVINAILVIILFFVVGFSFLSNLGKTIQEENINLQNQQNEVLPDEQVNNSFDKNLEINQLNTNETNNVNQSPVVTTTSQNDEKFVCAGTTPKVKLLSPLTGTLKVGQKVTVKWTSCNIPKTTDTLITFMSKDNVLDVFKGKNVGETTFVLNGIPGQYNITLDVMVDFDNEYIDNTKTPITVVK